MILEEMMVLARLKA
ncbi:hypothetical protein V2J09_024188 [Rumex salicifolius]